MAAFQVEIAESISKMRKVQVISTLEVYLHHVLDPLGFTVTKKK